MPRANADRLWWAGGGITAVLILAIAWFFAIHPAVSKTSALKDATASAQTQNAILQSKINRLRAQSDNLTVMGAQLAAAHQALPTDADLADFTRSVAKAVAQNGVILKSVSVTAPTVITANGTAPAAAKVGTKSDPVGQIYSISVTLNTVGSASHQLGLISALQGTGKRAALIASAQLAAATTGGKATSGDEQLTLQMQIFTAPQSKQSLDALAKELATAPK